jgi:hypothetical protein
MSGIEAPRGSTSSALRRYVTRLAARSGFPVRPWPYHQPRPRRLQRAAPPIVEVIPEDGDVTWLSRLARDVADAAGTIAVLDGGTPVAGDPDAGDPARVIGLLTAAAEQLHIGDTGLRFPRLRLVNYFADLKPTRRASAELVDALLDKLREYRSRRGNGSASDSGLISAFQTLNPWPITIALVAFVAPEFLFRMWFYGAPGLGRECRWLRDQHKVLAPDKSFNTFVLGLTDRPQATTRADTGLLATQAFLADLRATYQPRRWREARGWRRACAPILVLDQLDEKLPGLLATARDPGQPDPLLVIVVPPDQSSERAFTRQAIRVARDQYDDDDDDGLAGSPGKGRGLLTVAGVIGLAALAAILTLVALPRSQRAGHPATSRTLQAAACPVPAKPAAMTSIVPWTNPGPNDTECVGYSTTVPFTNPPDVDAGNAEQALQDRRLVYDQEQVFAMDRQAGQYASARTVLTLVYFAGLTAAPNDDYDSGEAEELEGLLAAQRLAFKETSGPMLKVVVANGGSKMQNAVGVANMLIPLFRGDRSLLGVVGLDRSVDPVKQAIALLGKQGIPVVATTLSADGIGAGDSSYFELVPDNTQEAELILDYIRVGVTAYFRQPASVYYSGGQATPSLIWIYHPTSSDPGDYYISSLVADLQRVRRTDPHFRGLPRVVPTTQLGANLCGADRVVVYAGRHDLPRGSKFNSFANFLRTIGKDCPLAKDRPFVIADDGVSRFIADPAARVQPGMGQESVSYVTKAIAVMQTGGKCLDQATAATVPGALSDFCQAYAVIVAGLRHALGASGNGVPFLWTGDRVGLAYDAAELFVAAAETQPGQLITRAQIPAAFESQSYPGVTGTLDFTAKSHTGKSHTGSNTPGGMPMAIVRIEVSSSSALPTCEYTSASGQILGFGPNDGGNSNPYLPCPSLSN